MSTSQTTIIEGDFMLEQILICLGAIVGSLCLLCSICTFVCVKRIQRLYDDLENINPNEKED